MEVEGYDYNELLGVGKVSVDALEFSKKVIRPGVKLLEAANEIEAFIKDKGCDFSFPINLSIDEQAAHYTPPFDDKSVFSENSVVKVDLGARRGFYLTDCAITIDLSGEHSKLCEAAAEALDAAISVVRSGVEVSKVGAAIEEAGKRFGLKPIKNLGGHGIEKDELHADVFIPNYYNGDQTKLEEGQVIAIEPFFTEGSAGMVGDGDVVEIFQRHGDSRPRSNISRELLDEIESRYITYPFAARWLYSDKKWENEFKVKRALLDLVNSDAVEPFPVLVEKSNGIVAQAEKELIVEHDSCRIVT
jgi:methionyl aminopeptidase